MTNALRYHVARSEAWLDMAREAAGRKGRKGYATWRRVRTYAAKALNSAAFAGWTASLPDDGFDRKFEPFRKDFGRAHGMCPREAEGWTPARAASAAGMITSASRALAFARSLAS
jgi:hypothetical protein